MRFASLVNVFLLSFLPARSYLLVDVLAIFLSLRPRGLNIWRLFCSLERSSGIVSWTAERLSVRAVLRDRPMYVLRVIAELVKKSPICVCKMMSTLAVIVLVNYGQSTGSNRRGLTQEGLSHK